MPHRAPPPPVPEHDLPYSVELQRKAIHLLALGIPAGMALLGNKRATLVLIPLALILFGADALRWRSEGFSRWIDRYFGWLMRGRERTRGRTIAINGATWVMIVATLLALLFPNRIAIFALVIFLICDAVAAIVGRRFGRIRWPGSFRTMEGTAAFVLAGLLIAVVYPGVNFWFGGLSVVSGAAAEIFRQPLNDNIRVPVATALALYLLERLAATPP